jgi:hypothetical protein
VMLVAAPRSVPAFAAPSSGHIAQGMNRMH